MKECTFQPKLYQKAYSHHPKPYSSAMNPNSHTINPNTQGLKIRNVDKSIDRMK